METRASILHVIIITSFIRPSLGDTFRPKCTAPSQESSLVLSSNIRGTFDILWSSLFTLLICTWTVQHLNIPAQRPRNGSTLSAISSIWRKVKWMLVTLVLPEFLVGKALQDNARARRSVSSMGQLAKDAGFIWTITHGFYADMGGFVLQAKEQDLEDDIVPAPIFLNYDSLKFARTSQSKNGKELAHIFNSLIEQIPKITEREIQDKSKGDFFVKATAVLQVTWMIVQTIARSSKGLAVSQLEIAVLAYAACAIITYILYWDKPQNIQVPTNVFFRKGLGRVELSHQDENVLRHCRPRSWFTTSLRLARYDQNAGKESRNPRIPIPNDARYDDVKSFLFTAKSLLTRMDDGFVIAGLVFGSLHCAAWNLAFPTPVERLLVRISFSCLPFGVREFDYWYFRMMGNLFDFHRTKSPPPNREKKTRWTVDDEL